MNIVVQGRHVIPRYKTIITDVRPRDHNNNTRHFKVLVPVGTLVIAQLPRQRNSAFARNKAFTCSSLPGTWMMPNSQRKLRNKSARIGRNGTRDARYDYALHTNRSILMSISSQAPSRAGLTAAAGLHRTYLHIHRTSDRRRTLQLTWDQ